MTVTADAATGSTFEGWSDACDGTARCSILMDEERSLSASFERERAEPQCVEGAAEDDPACSDEDLDAPPDEDLGAPLDEDLDALDGAPAPAAECADGRDNDGDGLTDTEQDPDCLSGDSESGTSTSPRPTRPQSDCRDGKDNDGDGLTDTAQDPNCLSGSTEAD